MTHILAPSTPSRSRLPSPRADPFTPPMLTPTPIPSPGRSRRYLHTHAATHANVTNSTEPRPPHRNGERVAHRWVPIVTQAEHRRGVRSAARPGTEEPSHTQHTSSCTAHTHRQTHSHQAQTHSEMGAKSTDSDAPPTRPPGHPGAARGRGCSVAAGMRPGPAGNGECPSARGHGRTPCTSR